MPRIKTVTIVGFGYVGRAVYDLFQHRKDIYHVAVYNHKNPTNFEPEIRDGVVYVSKSETNASDLVIVCVPTPQAADGSCDIRAVQETFSWLTAPLVLLKSTVPPGTSVDIALNAGQSIVFSPEFIGEGKYHVDPSQGPHPTDMLQHSFQIFGGTDGACSKVIAFFQPILGPHVEYCVTDWTTAELVKYAINSFLAMKVTFFNELADIAGKAGVSYDILRELILKDKRIGASHTMVFLDKRGFDGKCLPKDTSALVQYAWSKGLGVQLLATMIEVNKKYLAMNQKDNG